MKGFTKLFHVSSKQCLNKYVRLWKIVNTHNIYTYRKLSTTASNVDNFNDNKKEKIKYLPKDGLSLRDFLIETNEQSDNVSDIPTIENIPYIQNIHGQNQKGKYK